jgi:hypothetical protein
MRNKLADVLVRNASANELDARYGHIVVWSHVFVLQALRTPLADLSHLVVGKLPGTSYSSLFSHLVSNVVQVGSREEMVRIDAGRVVTAMENVDATGDAYIVEQLERYAMGCYNFTIESYASIAVTRLSGILPTAISRYFDAAEEYRERVLPMVRSVLVRADMRAIFIEALSNLPRCSVERQSTPYTDKAYIRHSNPFLEVVNA